MRCVLAHPQVGGNANFKAFMDEHGVPSNISLADKYNSEVCKVYKEKISCLAEVRFLITRCAPGA